MITIPNMVINLIGMTLIIIMILIIIMTLIIIMIPIPNMVI